MTTWPRARLAVRPPIPLTCTACHPDDTFQSSLYLFLVFSEISPLSFLPLLLIEPEPFIMFQHGSARGISSPILPYPPSYYRTFARN